MRKIVFLRKKTINNLRICAKSRKFADDFEITFF